MGEGCHLHCSLDLKGTDPQGPRLQKAGQEKNKHLSTVCKDASKDLLPASTHPARAGERRWRQGQSSPQPKPGVDEAGRDHHGVEQGFLLAPGVALLLQHTQPPGDPRQLQGKQWSCCQPYKEVQDPGYSPEAWDSKGWELPSGLGPPFLEQWLCGG